MTRPPQAKIAKQRKTLRVAMETNDVSFTQLAKAVDHNISVVSKAVNHGQFPRVVLKIKGVLGV